MKQQQNNLGLTKPIKTRTVLKSYKADENLTLDLLAKEYGMEDNIEKFIELLRKAVGNENFADLQRINAKRLKKGKGSPVVLDDLKEDTKVKARIIKDIKSQANAIDNTSKEEKTMTNIEKLTTELHNLNIQIQITDEQFQTVMALLNDALQNAEAIREEIRLKQEELIAVESEATNYQAEKENHERELADLLDKKASLEEEVKLLSHTFIITPKFRGKVKEGRNYVSTVESVQGVEVKREVIPETNWLTKPSIEAMVAAGYDSYNEFIEAFAFVQLVLSYKLQNKPYELICNNQKIQKLIDFEWERSGS